MGLMMQKDIRLKFSPVSSKGLCIADATQNPTNAYKVRGALASAELAIKEKKSVLVTASAGNHGAGIAFAAKEMGLKAIVYVPKNAPKVKVETIERFGAEVKFVGDNFDECLHAAQKECEALGKDATFVHPFDAPAVVAGQGTIGLELMAKLKQELAQRSYGKVRVVLPIGGGGLAAGVVSVLKTSWRKEYPPLEVVGVIDESSPASLLAMLRGRPVRALTDTIADGTKVEMVGQNFLAVAHLLDALVLLPHDDLVDAMRWYHKKSGDRLEGAGALALGGEKALRRHNLLNDPERVLSVPLLTGRNIDEDRFTQEVSAEQRMNRKLRRRQGFDVVLPEEQGQLLQFLETVRDFNITSLTYMRQVDSREGRLRVEFEVGHDQGGVLAHAITQRFPGSEVLPAGRHMVYLGGIRGTEAGSETLIRLADHPGSFYKCVHDLTLTQRLGSVDFLFYRKPSRRGAESQVVMGLADPSLAELVTPGKLLIPDVRRW
jgi:threonine dehydratase